MDNVVAPSRQGAWRCGFADRAPEAQARTVREASYTAGSCQRLAQGPRAHGRRRRTGTSAPTGRSCIYSAPHRTGPCPNHRTQPLTSPDAIRRSGPRVRRNRLHPPSPLTSDGTVGRRRPPEVRIPEGELADVGEAEFRVAARLPPPPWCYSAVGGVRSRPTAAFPAVPWRCASWPSTALSGAVCAILRLTAARAFPSPGSLRNASAASRPGSSDIHHFPFDTCSEPSLPSLVLPCRAFRAIR